MIAAVFESWPVVSRDVGVIIREALRDGEPHDVTVDVHDVDGDEHWQRCVAFRRGRGWITADLTTDEILYCGGELFAAAFTAVVGRPPSNRRRGLPERVFDVLLHRSSNYEVA